MRAREREARKRGRERQGEIERREADEGGRGGRAGRPGGRRVPELAKGFQLDLQRQVKPGYHLRNLLRNFIKMIFFFFFKWSS